MPAGLTTSLPHTLTGFTRQGKTVRNDFTLLTGVLTMNTMTDLVTLNCLRLAVAWGTLMTCSHTGDWDIARVTVSVTTVVSRRLRYPGWLKG
ncbi:hypothetical protein AU892_27180 [Salmonella enterica subsp. diarizonae]|nr:hypothetical protein [Salmonella enterica subsp. diarizonae]